MQRSLAILFLIAGLFLCHSCVEPEGPEVAFPYELMDSDPEAAYKLVLQLKEESERANDLLGLIEYNYILGYIQKERGFYDKALFHYLEAIGHGEKDSKKFAPKLILIYNNCGVIYRKFKHYQMAEGAYERANELGREIGNFTLQIDLSYNLSFVYKNTKAYDRSVHLLQKVLPLAKPSSPIYFDILNSLAIRYRLLEQYDHSLSIARQLLGELPADHFKMRGYAWHTLGKTYRAMGDPNQALAHYEQAIVEKSKTDVVKADLFASLKEAGDIYMEQEKPDKAADYFSQAEVLLPRMTSKPMYFELYNLQAMLYTKTGDADQVIHYSQLYATHTREHFALMEEIEASDKRLNIQLVTEQFYNRMAAEERATRNRVLWIGAGVIVGLLGIALVVVIIRAKRRENSLLDEIILLMNLRDKKPE